MHEFHIDWATPFTDRDSLFDPHAVKVVLDHAGYALYFSRAPVPWHRDEFLHDTSELPAGVPFLRHVGLYAYRRAFLLEFVTLEQTRRELDQQLEQLRALDHGHAIAAAVVDDWHSVPVDVPEDVARVEARIRTA